MSGDEDSPMANRGCRPRSRSSTRRPRRRAIIARIEPAKPEPTTTRSQVGVTPRLLRACVARAATAGGTRCSRFMAVKRRTRSRVARALDPSLDVPQVGLHDGPAQRQAVLDGQFQVRQARGAGAGSSASIAPLPPRTGITVHTRAPLAAARSIDRHAHSRLCSAGRNGGFSKMNTRRDDAVSARNPDARLKSSSVMRLLSRASTSGWAVSRPTATSSAPDSRSRNARHRAACTPSRNAGCDSTITRS